MGDRRDAVVRIRSVKHADARDVGMAHRARRRVGLVGRPRPPAAAGLHVHEVRAAPAAGSADADGESEIGVVLMKREHATAVGGVGGGVGVVGEHVRAPRRAEARAAVADERVDERR